MEEQHQQYQHQHDKEEHNHNHNMQFLPPCYPEAVASHSHVVDDREIFLSTLTQFHASFSTRISIPKIGGKDLDLHLLYKAVTSRGGLETVIRERKWKEIAFVLDFPPTTTSASYVLRKFYSNFLHHYEQVYFFRVQGALVPPPAPPTRSSDCDQTPVTMVNSEPRPRMQTPVTMVNSEHRPRMQTPVTMANSEHKPRMQKLDSAIALGVDPASSIGSVVTGSIDAKFDNAYLITVTVGARRMKGVLYQIPPNSTRPQGASVANFSVNANLDSFKFGNQNVHQKKRKRKPKKDSNAPRRNRSGYTFFFAEQRSKLKSTVPEKNKEISKMIGDLWNNLPEEEKINYQERGMRDKERYMRELNEYKERTNLKEMPSDIVTEQRTLLIEGP